MTHNTRKPVKNKKVYSPVAFSTKGKQKVISKADAQFTPATTHVAEERAPAVNNSEDKNQGTCRTRRPSYERSVIDRRTVICHTGPGAIAKKMTNMKTLIMLR
ncbi:hypothetical protein RvY_15914-2 [Ramazzottius varieornatus]|uniref:Uncharacterized protein n=1 Tax=Ramazzottius varieornatus TaxID=947166 RepID=A0A1D1W391_RAMVA|nr:hypothetical protein RvY_15914-2 [Ramazzottius varieornatus]